MTKKLLGVRLDLWQLLRIGRCYIARGSRLTPEREATGRDIKTPESEAAAASSGDDRIERQQARPTEIRKIWFILGAMSSSISVISFVQKLFSIGLVPVLGMFVNFYRRMLYPLFDIVGYVIHVPIPSWYRDIFLLSLVFSITRYRVLRILVLTASRYKELCLLAFNSITLLGCVIPFHYLIRYIGVRKKIKKAKRE